MEEEAADASLKWWRQKWTRRGRRGRRGGRTMDVHMRIDIGRHTYLKGEKEQQQQQPSVPRKSKK